MFSTIWSPGKPDQYWRAYLTGGCLLAVACAGIWMALTLTGKPMIISGKVLDAQGQPITEARIYFTDGPAPLPDLAALTNYNGEFSVSVSTSGEYRVGCAADGFRAADVPVRITEGQNASVRIILKK